MDSGIGDTLRHAREELGRDLDEAARELRAQRHHLEALEDERFDLFGGDVYAKGHLRSYARWLGLDPEPLVQRYRTEIEGAGYDPHILSEHPVARRSRPSLPGWIVWAALGGLVLIAAFAVAGTLGGRAPEPVAGPVDGVTEEEEVTPPADEPSDTEEEPEPEPEPEAEPTPEGVELVLIVEDRAWIRVVVDDQTHEGTYEPGEVLDFFDDEEIRVRLGNAGGVTFQLNDEVLGSPAGRGQVWEGVCTPDGCEEA